MPVHQKVLQTNTESELSGGPVFMMVLSIQMPINLGPVHLPLVLMDWFRMRVHSKATALFKGCETGSSVVLRPAATLLVSEVLTCVGGEEAWQHSRKSGFFVSIQGHSSDCIPLTHVLGIFTASLHL